MPPDGFFGIQIVQNSISARAPPGPCWGQLMTLPQIHPIIGWEGNIPSPFPTPWHLWCKTLMPLAPRSPNFWTMVVPPSRKCGVKKTKKWLTYVELSLITSILRLLTKSVKQNVRLAVLTDTLDTWHTTQCWLDTQHMTVPSMLCSTHTAHAWHSAICYYMNIHSWYTHSVHYSHHVLSTQPVGHRAAVVGKGKVKAKCATLLTRV